MKGQGISADILEYRGLYSCATLIGALAMPSHGGTWRSIIRCGCKDHNILVQFYNIITRYLIEMDPILIIAIFSWIPLNLRHPRSILI